MPSKKIVPLELGFLVGPTRSALSCRSSGMDALRSQSFIVPHISARLLPHITEFLAFQPKFTPRTLYRCSFSLSSIPYPSPPSSITVSTGLNSSMASITRPTMVIVSSPEYRLMLTMSRPWRTSMTVESAPPRAGSIPMTTGAELSLYRGRFIASSTTVGLMNWSSPALGNSPYTSTLACGESSPYSAMIWS